MKGPHDSLTSGGGIFSGCTLLSLTPLLTVGSRKQQRGRRKNYEKDTSDDSVMEFIRSRHAK